LPHCVYVSSKKKLREAQTAFITKLSRKAVEKFLNNADDISGNGLFKKISNIYKQYIWHEDERLYLLQTVWTIGTYQFTLFSHFGYQFIYSKLMRSGKSRTEEIISHLAYEATQLLNSPSAPSIRETVAEGRTILLDTLERLRESSTEAYGAVMELMDTGFRNGGTIPVMVKENGKWIKKDFSVYSPFGMAAIEKGSLSPTALDRSFCIENRRKPLKVKKAKYNYFQCEKKCRPLRDNCYLWALQTAERVAEIYGSKELQKSMEQMGLNDRAFDIWMPLFAVLEALGLNKDSKEWKELSSLAIEMHKDPEIAEAVKQLEIIKVLRKGINGGDELVENTTTLVGLLGITEREVRGLMEQLGVKKDSAWKDGGSLKCWKIPLKTLDKAEKEIRSYIHPKLLTRLTRGSE